MFGQFFVLFATMGIGYLCTQRKWISAEANVGLGNLVLFITIPVLLFSSMANTSISNEMLVNFGIIVVLQFLCMLVFGRILRMIYSKLGYPKEQLDMLEVTAASENNAFIGLPIALMFFGQEGVVYMSASVMGLNFYVWSYGLYTVKGGTGETIGSVLKTILKGAINPNISSIALGLLVAVLGLTKYIPSFLADFIASIGGTSTPLSLIYIGALAGSGGIIPLLREKDTFRASVIKMIVVPFLAFCLMFILPVEPIVKAVFFMAMAMPAAAVVPMVVGRYGVGVQMSSKIVLMTTVLSMITLPICVWITQIWV